MSKYSKMVESNQKASKEKIDCAIRTIKEMLDKEEQLLVCELVRKTGLSRAFFYKNPTVSKFLNEAEYSRAMKSHFRKFGNQMSGSGNHLCNYASLLA